MVETGSTNKDLIALAEAGAVADRTVLYTDHQTAGRGRLDRRWDAPAGTNLLASILFTDPPDAPTTLPQAVGRAALDAIEELADEDLESRLGLKWPNDLLLDDRKLSGVLSQRAATSGAVVVGIGLNVGWAPDGAASLRGDLGLDVGPALVLDLLLGELSRILDAGNVAANYRSRLSTLGSVVRVEMPGGAMMTGTAIDLDADGRLVVERNDLDADLDADHERRRVTLDVGDIVHLRRG